MLFYRLAVVRGAKVVTDAHVIYDTVCFVVYVLQVRCTVL